MADPKFEEAVKAYAYEHDNYDVAYLAGSENNGRAIDFDRHFSDAIRSGEVRYNGHAFDPRPFIRVHEAVEGAIVRKQFEPKTWQLGSDPHLAHEVALCAERRAVEHADMDWGKYTRSMDQFIRPDDAGIKHPPPDLMRMKASTKVGARATDEGTSGGSSERSMAKLTAAGRKRIPSSSFALPGGRYPIEDASHARNALSRASQNASPSEQATIKRKVKARYPGIQVGARSARSEWKGHSVWNKGSGVQFGDRMPDTSGDVAKSYAQTKKERIGGTGSSQQLGARMPNHMHALTMASATHLHNAGHLDGPTMKKIHRHAKNALASSRGPSANSQPMPPGAMGPPPPDMGGGMAQIPSFGSMAPPAMGGGGGQAVGARKKKW